jgi:class 3 adenylate cyclase
MLALYRAGRQADALEAYRAARQALVGGLGIEPSRELRDLEAAILRQDVSAPEMPPAGHAAVAPDARRRVTCVFSQLAYPDEVPSLDPESLRHLLDRYHDAARAVCARHGGTVAELRGDGVLAVFGVPVAHEDDAQRALRAAAELGTRSEGLPFGLCARSGVCTGDVVGSVRGAAAAPLLGEAVAGAERLARSSACGEVRVAESTWRLVRHAAHGTELPEGGFVLHGVDAHAPRSRAASTGRWSGGTSRSAACGSCSPGSSPAAHRSSSRSSASRASASRASPPSCGRSPAIAAWS